MNKCLPADRQVCGMIYLDVEMKAATTVRRHGLKKLHDIVATLIK